MDDRSYLFWFLVFVGMALIGALGIYAGWWPDGGCAVVDQTGVCD